MLFRSNEEGLQKALELLKRSEKQKKLIMAYFNYINREILDEMKRYVEKKRKYEEMYCVKSNRGHDSETPRADKKNTLPTK